MRMHIKMTVKARCLSPVSALTRIMWAACCGTALVIASGCGSGGGSDGDDDTVTTTVQPAPSAADNGFVPLTMAALAKGRFTLNVPWTRADLVFEEFDDPDNFAYSSFTRGTGIDEWVRPYTTTMTEYEARRRQCEQDYQSFYPVRTFDSPTGTKQYTFRDRKCYPNLQLANELDRPPDATDGTAKQVLQRYGYYCGVSYPGWAAAPDELQFDAPEPLDGVDYCCRLHDVKAWDGRGLDNLGDDRSNECGMLMCLRKVTAKGLTALPPDVEEARQHWYGEGATGGASYLCPNNQSDDALPPVGE